MLDLNRYLVRASKIPSGEFTSLFRPPWAESYSFTVGDIVLHGFRREGSAAWRVVLQTEEGDFYRLPQVFSLEGLRMLG